MISLKHKFLFIHIPKTAGNSIQNILKHYSEEKIVKTAPHHDGLERFEVRSNSYAIRKHSTLREYQQELSSQLVDDLYKFTCVRNPWERMISYFFSPHRGLAKWNRNNFIRLVTDVAPTTHYVTGKHNEVQPSKCFDNMDAIIRFENLERGFNDVCAQIGIPAPQLPRRNASKHRHYSTYYDTELIDLVKSRFQDEIDFFGYEYESAQT